jgi:hypothetical protein
VGNEQVKAATAVLKETGEFKNGIYYPAQPDATHRVQDAFEAVFEHVTGQRVTYPKPRYDDPIKMKPESFDWQDLPGQPGAKAKYLGDFTERHHELALVHIDAGKSAMLGPRAGIQLVYVVEGTGTVDGNVLRTQTAFEVPSGSAAQVTATAALALIVIGLPVFAAAKAPSNV